MAVLSLKNVGYTYEKTTKPVFQGLNAEFEPGRLYCIMGRSGAGKTSLLSLLAGLDICTEGAILYEGEDLRELASWLGVPDRQSARRGTSAQMSSPSTL